MLMTELMNAACVRKLALPCNDAIIVYLSVVVREIAEQGLFELWRSRDGKGFEPQ